MPENCCNLPKFQTKMQNLREFHQKDANGIAKSEDPDQTVENYYMIYSVLLIFVLHLCVI